ncbi:hypothetical protein [Alsobacter metallidurans]|nr:hypothetical protein [Alsobacter metallidurans]
MTAQAAAPAVMQDRTTTDAELNPRRELDRATTPFEREEKDRIRYVLSSTARCGLAQAQL